MNPLRFCHNTNRFLIRRMITCWLVLCAASLAAHAQSGRLSPYQDESDGVSAGGKWMEFHSEDKMTAAKKVRFELLADNYFREDPEYKPRVELFCSDGKLTLADFNPGTRLSRPDYPGFWGQPKMEVLVRIDDTHRHRGWNWVNGHFLSMDKGTTRGLIGAQTFKVEARTKSGPQIAEFSPGGLDLSRVKQACDLTPQRPSND
ncbi:MAG: hypothetical protein LAO24_05180 [Acidobacteriia bacterium]|nr:hypothetical protein [Terriglobia bacterium]